LSETHREWVLLILMRPHRIFLVHTKEFLWWGQVTLVSRVMWLRVGRHVEDEESWEVEETTLPAGEEVSVRYRAPKRRRYRFLYFHRKFGAKALNKPRLSLVRRRHARCVCRLWCSGVGQCRVRLSVVEDKVDSSAVKTRCPSEISNVHELMEITRSE
jgi:hypothetical protein